MGLFVLSVNSNSCIKILFFSIYPANFRSYFLFCKCLEALTPQFTKLIRKEHGTEHPSCGKHPKVRDFLSLFKSLCPTPKNVL